MPAPTGFTHKATQRMASITQYAGRWRAHVCVGKVRASKLLRTRREAVAWADAKEAELTGGAALTFAQAAGRWLKWKLPRLENANNVRTVEQSIEDHVLPKLGAKKLTEIKRADLVAVVRDIAAKGRVETAHRVGQRIRAIFDHAVDHGDIETHPAAGLSRVLPVTKPRKMAAVATEELPALLKAIHGYPEPVTRLGLQLLAHTFVRTTELIGARWDELRDDVWVVPAERMKLGLPHVVPISPQVRAILDQLEPMTGESPYWLASTINPNVPISNNTLLFALYRLGYRGRMTGHGFRAVASSILNESGLFSADAIERQLAHRETDRVRESYHRASYLDERRRMMAWYSERLAALA
jgi:integrase